MIKVAILAEEPIGWCSGKHYFPIILDNYTWSSKDMNYKFKSEFIYDKDIINGKLKTSNFDVLLVPGGGVGDGETIVKAFTFFPNAKKWKKAVSDFIKNGGGYVGICGGAALMTDLKTAEKKPRTFLEQLYNKSSLDLSCVSSYYKSFACPLFYLFQNKYPEKIGASSYVFSFAPGSTVDGKRIHSGGVPIDFQINKENPIFSDFPNSTLRMRWWGGPALVLPDKIDRNLKILGKYPIKDISKNNSTKVYAWRYKGEFFGLIRGFIKSLRFIKKEKDSMKNLLLYTYFFSEKWVITDKIIDLDYANKASITAEIYPNENNGRILLCTSHPEYMVWQGGAIEENTNAKCLADGLHIWKDIKFSNKNLKEDLTCTWWVVRRFIAWAAKIPENHLPPIQNEEESKEIKSIISENIFWDGSLKNQLKNI